MEIFCSSLRDVYLTKIEIESSKGLLSRRFKSQKDPRIGRVFRVFLDEVYIAMKKDSSFSNYAWAPEIISRINHNSLCAGMMMMMIYSSWLISSGFKLNYDDCFKWRVKLGCWWWGGESWIRSTSLIQFRITGRVRRKNWEKINFHFSSSLALRFLLHHRVQQ